MTAARIQRYIGNTIILTALIATLYLLYPLITSELTYRFQPFNPTTTTSQFTLTYPTLKLQEKVIANVDPWNPDQYQSVLRTAVAHATGSALPSESGTTYLFAHSSADPVELLRNNPAFYRLNRANVGDHLSVNYQQKEYTYQVTDIVTVRPNEVEYLLDQSTDQLILQTCTPIGTDWNRLLVIAKPVS